jgi:hypothetical protein
VATWKWLVAYAAEYTPGPWRYDDPGDGRASQVVSLGVPETATDGPVALTELWWRTPDQVAVTDQSLVDYERDANGRLMADAPAMLEVLAEWAEYAQTVEGRSPSHVNKLRSLLRTTGDLIRRHVRLGCVPVDAESRSERPSACQVSDESGGT